MENTTMFDVVNIDQDDADLAPWMVNLTNMTTMSTKTIRVMSMEVRNHTVRESSFMFVSGVIGNVLAMVLMATSPVEQRRTTFYKLMAGLAFTDLFGTCATSPVVIYTYATGNFITSGMPVCHYFSFMMIFAGFSTMTIVCAMAIERYICVCHPYTYQCKLPKSYSRYALVFSWVFAGFIACLPFMGLGSNTVQFPNTWCFFNVTSRVPSDTVFNYIYAIISLLAITATFVCNIAATVCVLSLRRRQRALTASQRVGSLGRMRRSLAQRVAEMHMVCMLLGVTVIFTLCYGPLVVFVIVCQTSLIKELNVKLVFILVIRIASFNQILDPWVYILVRRELRWKILSIFRRVCGIKASKPALSTQKSLPTSPTEESLNGKFLARDAQKETEMTFLTFCYHCLCDPPVQRSSSSLARFSSTWNNPTNRSPSLNRKLGSTDSFQGGCQNGCVITKQPSPMEELLLAHHVAKQEAKLLADSTNGVYVT